MHNPRGEMEPHVEKNVRTMSRIREVIVTLILVTIGVIIIANLPEALSYEDKKMEILRSNGLE
jgi:hypothetical protein